MASCLGLYRRPHFLSDPLVRALRRHLQSAAGEPAAVQAAPGRPLAVAEEIRRAWEAELPDDLHDEVLGCLEDARPELSRVFGVAVEPCDGVAALRYPAGAFYRTHRDAGARPDPHGLHRRALSLVLFLNTAAPGPGAAFGGGRLRLHEGAGTSTGPCDVVPEAGTLVAFPSAWLHEVTPVEWGTRYTLTAWLLRPDEPGT